MNIVRKWAMPNRNTFSIKPIAAWLQPYIDTAKIIVDPFARDNKLATITNDLNTATSAEYHMDAVPFLQMLIARNVRADLLLLDPPYSLGQVVKTYDGFGKAIVLRVIRDLANQLLARDGKCLTFGWNSNGLGASRGWRADELLIVAHGGIHNDTLCLAESRAT